MASDYIPGINYSGWDVSELKKTWLFTSISADALCANDEALTVFTENGVFFLSP